MSEQPSSEATPELPGSAGHDPDRPAALLEFMSTGWAPRTEQLPGAHPAAKNREARRRALAASFPGEVLVVPTGGYRTRANDTEYRFRPGTEFAYLVGSHEPDAVLVIDAQGGAVLYQAPSMDRSTPSFFTDRMYGELWVGPRPTLAATSALLGIETRPLEELDKLSGPARVVRGYDARVEKLFETDDDKDTELAQVLSEQRLVKDEHEIDQPVGEQARPHPGQHGRQQRVPVDRHLRHPLGGEHQVVSVL